MNMLDVINQANFQQLRSHPRLASVKQREASVKQRIVEIIVFSWMREASALRRAAVLSQTVHIVCTNRYDGTSMSPQ
jgi:hypothetical protein